MHGELEYAANMMGVAKATQRALAILVKAAEQAETYAVSGHHGSADADVHDVAEKLAAAVALLNDVLAVDRLSFCTHDVCDCADPI